MTTAKARSKPPTTPIAI